MPWLEVSLEVGRGEAEAVAAVFAQHGYGGVAIDEVFLHLPEGQDYVLDPQGTVTVKAYLPVNRGLGRRRRLLEAALGRLPWPLPPFQARVLREEDWWEAWKEHFHPLAFGPLVVKPSWRDYVLKDGEVVVELDPGGAFGTGHHATTAACLRELASRLRPGMDVLDLGTGSGILAIAAAKLGARRALALDLDAEAVKVARSNVRRNRVGSRVRVAQGTALLPGGLQVEGAAIYPSFDLILANLVARTILELAASLSGCLKPGGCLIASGIIAQYLKDVEARLREVGLEVLGVAADDDWRTVTAQKMTS